MYLPPKFAPAESERAAALRDASFAHLVSHVDGEQLLTPLPMLYDADTDTLIGHVARANPHARADGADTVAVFAGPAAYVSPAWYATKAETGKVVPTWNYDVLAVHGTLRVHDDADWVLDVVRRLTQRHERHRESPWAVADAPASFIAAQLHAIVGVALPVRRVEAKAKMSQNQPARNRAGVIAGLGASASPADRAVAERVAACDPERSGTQQSGTQQSGAQRSGAQRSGGTDAR